MKNDPQPNPAQNPEKVDSRRQFLQSAGLVASALVLTRALPADAQAAETAPVAGQTAPATAAPSDTNSAIINLSEHKELEKVGGFEIFDVGESRVIVAHTETGFVACSAICTHKGCEIGYRLSDKQFVCPCHGARFDEAGKVVKGPARVDLKSFDAANSLVVKAKTQPQGE